MWKCSKNCEHNIFLFFLFLSKRMKISFSSRKIVHHLWEREPDVDIALYFTKIYTKILHCTIHNSSVVILPTPLIISLKPKKCIWLGADTPNQFVPWHKWNIIAATISLGKNSISNMHYRKSIYHQKHKK